MFPSYNSLHLHLSYANNIIKIRNVKILKIKKKKKIYNQNSQALNMNIKKPMDRTRWMCGKFNQNWMLELDLLTYSIDQPNVARTK